MQVQQFYVKENYLHENYFKVKEGKMNFLETIDEDYSEANYHEAKIVEDINCQRSQWNQVKWLPF